MTVKCTIKEHPYDGIDIRRYGLQFYRQKRPNQPVRIIGDLLTNIIEITHYCDVINNNDLDEISIDDVIEDILAS